MAFLLLGLVVFLGVHSVSVVNPAWRERMVARLGEGPWKGLYALLSLSGLVLIIVGYGQARLDPILLYTPPIWLKHIALLLLVPVFPLFLATYLRGGIQRRLEHPTLLATKLWATAHLLANGMLADIVLFASFLAWAIAQRVSMQRRAQRLLPGASPSVLNDVIAVAAGVALYVVFIVWGHAWLVGVAPIAF